MEHPPKTDALQRYGADLSDFAYSQERVRQMLEDAHAHYEAQVRTLDRLKTMFAAVEDARNWFGKAMALKLALAGTDIRVAALREAMKDAARTLEGAHLGDGQEVAYIVAKGLRRAAE